MPLAKMGSSLSASHPWHKVVKQVLAQGKKLAKTNAVQPAY